MYTVTKELLEYEERKLTQLRKQLETVKPTHRLANTPEYVHYKERLSAFKRDTLRFQKGL